MSKVKHIYDQATIQTRAQVLEKFGQESLEFRQADRNWKATAALCAQEMADKMIASHGTDIEQGWWYVNDGTRILERDRAGASHGRRRRVCAEIVAR